MGKVIINKIMSSILKPYGFEKLKSTWSSRSSDAVLMFEPQKSNYSNEYYMNIGVFYPGVDDVEHPIFRNAHIVNRLEEIVPLDERSRCKSLLDLDSDITLEARVEGLNRYLIEFGLPFLSKLDRLAKVKSLLSQSTPEQVFPKMSLLRYLFPERNL